MGLQTALGHKTAKPKSRLGSARATLTRASGAISKQHRFGAKDTMQTAGNPLPLLSERAG